MISISTAMYPQLNLKSAFKLTTTVCPNLNCF